MTILPLIVGYSMQWNRGLYLGKTPEQIVAMGRTKWNEFYGKKKGYSTVDMVEAEDKYADALANLNDRAMKRIDSKKRDWLLKVRKDMLAYSADAHQVGYILSGGGTMWNLFNSSVRPDIEQLISDCIVKKEMPRIKMRSFETAFGILDKAIGSESEYNKDENRLATYSDLMKKRTALGNKQKVLLPLVMRGTWQDATRWQLFMHRKIDVASAVEMTGK